MAAAYGFEFWDDRRAAARRVAFRAIRAEERTRGNVMHESVCRYWLEGACSAGDRCRFSHVYDLDRVPLCAFYLHKVGLDGAPVKFHCAEGASCKFRHYTHPGERDTAVKTDFKRAVNLRQ